MRNEWVEKKIKEFAVINMGQSPKGIYYNSNSVGLPFLQGNRTFGKKHPFYDTWTKVCHKIAQKDEVLLSVRAPVGDLNIAIGKVCIGRGLCSISMKNNQNEYLYYLLKHNMKKIISSETGTTFGSINKSIIENTKVITTVCISEQKNISSILSSFDNKIEINNKINEKLETLAQDLYKHWFVEFEFPDKEGLPYKSSGGEMEDSDLGLIPKNWNVINQGRFFPVLTGKKNANFATQYGEYKFFTCSQNVLSAPNYSFDGEAILVAGNGDFNVKYYKGKFEAYQRTYVLIPNNPKLTGLLYFAIKRNLSDITSGHRGSVIKFITKGDLEDYTFAFPNEEKLEKMSVIFSDIVSIIEHNKKENEKLAEMRDLLLPKLMTGEIRVPVKE